MCIRSFLFASSLLLTPISFVQAQDFDPAGIARFEATVQDHVDRHIRSGYAAIIQFGDEIHIIEAGFADIENQIPFTIDTQVRIGSMSKPITAAAIMMLIEENKLSLETPVGDILPEIGAMRVASSLSSNDDGSFSTIPTSRAMTIRDLLTHTSGLGYIFDGRTELGQHYLENSLYSGSGDLEQKIDDLTNMPLYFQPGERWQYSYSSDVLGRVIEVITGETLEDFFQSRIFIPLGMTSTTFFPIDNDLQNIAVLYAHGEDGQLHRQFSEEAPEQVLSWASGGGGLVSTANDFLLFSLMLAHNGSHGDLQLLSKATIEVMTQNQVDIGHFPPSMSGLGYGYGLGVVLPPEEGVPVLGMPGEYGWSGVFDTNFFISPSVQLVGVMMTQEQPGPHKPEESTNSWWHSAAYDSLPQ
jgi:CubicO group peptidase (beta-lactamase class C family)